MRLPAGPGGLTATSLALTHQIRTVSARRLSAAIGTLNDDALRARIVTALRLWLDISPADLPRT